MQKIAILYDASQAVLSTFDLDEVLQRILMIARDYFHLQNVAILLLDKDTRELHPRCVIGWDPGHDSIRLPLEQGITGSAARQKRPIYAPDVSKDANYVSTAKSTRSELAIPLMVRDEVVGVLDCQSENENHFDNDKIDLLTLFSTQASMALQNAHLYSLERQRAKQLEVINAIAQQTTAVLDQEELLAKVCGLIQQAFQVGHVSVLLRDDEGVVLRASYGRFTACSPAGGRLPATTGLWGRALAEGKTLIENDVRNLHEYVGFYRETQSRMCIPLVSFGQTLGVLMLERDVPQAQAMIVEKAGMVGGRPASISTSRARLLQVRLGTTAPQTVKSGCAPPSCPTIWRTTGTESSIASKDASGPSTLAKGVRTPAASQISRLEELRMMGSRIGEGMRVTGEVGAKAGAAAAHCP